FLDLLARDGGAAANHYYFDVLPLHLYGRSNAVYDLPMGDINRLDHGSLHSEMRARGFDKPIWVNEAGVPVWEGGGINGPGRANIGNTGDPYLKGVELITLYGTPYGKVIVIWNLDTGGAREVKIPARTPSATLVDKYGRESALPARAGLYSLTLPPATNNNNF